MTRDQAIALSLIADLPRRGLTARLEADDPRLLDRARDAVDRVREVLRAAAAGGLHAVTWQEPTFPAVLRQIPDCPPALWFRGTPDVFDAPAVAIVGSRAATAVALQTAEHLAGELAALGVVIVSGMARGVDSAAHRGALRTGRTIAVLGSGADVAYPPEHKGLSDEIAASGLVLSEYPPGTPPLPMHFPARNRLISGLVRAVVVIEASEKSGSLITARCALEQGRDVMAVPGNVLSGRNRGGHALIRDGAAIVESAADVMAELALPPRGSEGTSAAVSAASRDPLLLLLEPGEPCDLDTLAARSGVDAGRLLSRLLDLELSGLIARTEGGRFLRSARPC